jgi:hypothetical protein
MKGERDRDSAPAGSASEPGHCLLLLRSPNDREIYEAFRTIATHAKRGCKEHLGVEGNLSLTAGLCEPQTPGTVERLLSADVEMIDQLELEFGGLRWTYLRSGGHPPFRESFFDEIHIQQVDVLSLSDSQLHDLIESMISQLPIATHSGEGALCDLVSEAFEHARRSAPPSNSTRDEKHH